MTSSRGYHIDFNSNGGIIADSSSRVITQSQVSSPIDWLKFLLEYYEDSLKVFRNLNYSTANLIRMLNWPIEAGKLLWQNHEVEDTLNNYIINHVPGKFLSIKYGRGYGNLFASFSDMLQYEEEELDNQEKTPEYCVKKAKEAKRIGDATLEAFRELGINAQTLTSPIRAFERNILRNMDIFTVDDYPDEVGELFYECLHGGWVETFKIGHFPMAYSYDIVGAYLGQLAKLPDLRLGTWIEGTRKPPDALLGTARGIVTIDSDFSPISFGKTFDIEIEEGKYKEEKSFTPKGTWPTALTQAQIDFIHNYKRGTFQTERGYWWTCEPEKLVFPFKQIAEDLYAKKEICSPLAKDLIKRIYSGIVGYKRQMIWNEKTGEYEFGKYYDPVGTSIVEANTSLQVAQTAIENDIVPLRIATDSMTLNKMLPESCLGTNVGQWKLKSQGECIIVSSGLAAMSSDKDSKSDFSLSIEKLKEMIGKDPAAKKYIMKKLSFVSLGTAIKNRWSDLGKIEEASRTLDIDGEAKRYYPEFPTCGAELMSKQYESESWDADILSTMI